MLLVLRYEKRCSGDGNDLDAGLSSKPGGDAKTCSLRTDILEKFC